jgi:hypothetical protein
MLHGPEDVVNKDHVAFIDPATDLIIDHIYSEMTTVEGGELRIGISKDVLDCLSRHNDLCVSDFEEALAKLERRGVLSKCGNGCDDICVYRVRMELDRIYCVLIGERDAVEVFPTVGTVEVLGLGEIEFFHAPEGGSSPAREVWYTLASKHHVKALPGYEHVALKSVRPSLVDILEELIILRLSVEEAKVLLKMVAGIVGVPIRDISKQVTDVLHHRYGALSNEGENPQNPHWTVDSNKMARFSFEHYVIPEGRKRGKRKDIVEWPEGRGKSAWLKELRRISCQEPAVAAPPPSPPQIEEDLPPEADEVLESENLADLLSGVRGSVLIQLDEPLPEGATISIQDMDDDRLAKALVFHESLLECAQAQIEAIETEQKIRVERRRQARIEELRHKERELQQELQAVQQELLGI